MSPQLTLSSLFSILALASLCVMANVSEQAGVRPVAVSQGFTLQAELAPGLLGD